ncbi:MAG: hypothetical protein ACRD7E_07215 [Bryobacteraceae bacterium]
MKDIVRISLAADTGSVIKDDAIEPLGFAGFVLGGRRFHLEIRK